jgi:hypothetical protein
MNAIDVTFTVPVRARDRADVRDALFIGNWSLVATAPLPIAAPLVQFVERIDALTVRVLFDFELDPGTTYLVVLDQQTTDVYGLPLSSCASLSVGPAFSRFATATGAALQGAVDVSNPFVSQDSPLGKEGPLGTYSATSTGDLANESGRAYLRKRVLRRATSVEGSFFHLPGYGFGVPLKTRTRADFLRSIQSKARAQILLEPDVAECEVVASLVGGSTFAVRLAIRVSDRSGIVTDLEAVVSARAS